MNFKNQKVSKVFMEKEIRSLSPKVVMDFLPKMKKSLPSEMAILKKWEDFFKENKVPFITTTTGHDFTIWKRRRV